jgi:hypothetical protein
VPQVKYGISVTFDAPLTFVYKWCTDFHADDPKIIGAPYTRHVIEKTKSRAIWIQHYSRGGVEMEGVRIVNLTQPRSWHLESVNEELYRSGDYILTSLGRGKTKLTIKLKTDYRTIEPVSAFKLNQDLTEDWEKYGAALQKDYDSIR